MKVLVTGANGFIGSAVTRALVARGHDVSALVRRDSNLGNLASLPVRVHVGDVRDAPSVTAALDGCEAVIHTAADYRLRVPDPETMYSINVDGTKTVIDAAVQNGVRRVVYTSSVATLGATADESATDEDRAPNEADMTGHYKRSKFLAEQAAIDMTRKRNAPVVIVNPSTPLGPGDTKPTPTGRIVRDAIEGRIPAFVDTGLNIVHVDDVANGHLAALARGAVGRRYILGGEDMSLRQLLTYIACAIGRRPPSVAIPHGLAMLIARVSEVAAGITGHDPRATVDGVRMSRMKMFYSSNRAVTELGYRFRPATEAIDAAISWFTEAGAADKEQRREKI